MNWSTYQDEQLKILKNLNTSFSQSLQYAKEMNAILGRSKTFFDTANQALPTVVVILDKVEHAISAITRDLVTNFNYAGDTFSNIVKTAGHTIQDVANNSSDSLDRLSDAAEEAAEEVNSNSRGKGNVLDSSYILREILFKLSSIGETANEWSYISNDMIKMTSTNGELVAEFRNTLVEDIIPELNADTGYYFNPQEVYQQMVSIANATGIGNMDVLEEILRPSLLAYESMDVNLSTVSGLLGRWNARYNFSSEAMEVLVNDIKTNTANNMTSAEAAFSALDELETQLAFMAGGDEDKLGEIASGVVDTIIRYQDIGLDTDWLVKAYSDIAKGDFQNTMYASILSNSDDKGVTISNIQDIFESGKEGVERISEALLSGMSNIALGADREFFGRIMETFGLDAETMQQIANMSLYDDYQSATDFLTKQLLNGGDTTAEESVEEKFVTAQETTHKFLSNIFEKVADIQEALGISLTDVAWIGVGVSSLAASVAAGGLLNKIGSLIGLGGGSTSILASLGGMSSLMNVALPAVAGAIAVGGIIYGINENTKYLDSVAEYINQNFFGKETINELTNTEGGKLVYKKSVDSEGNTSWSTGVVSAEEYMNNEESYEKLANEFLQSTSPASGEKESWWSKVGSFAKTVGAIVGRSYGIGDEEDMKEIAEKGWSAYKISQQNSTTEKIRDLLNTLSTSDMETYAAYVNAGSKLVEDIDTHYKFLTDIAKYTKKYSEGKVWVGTLSNGRWEDRSNVTGYATGSNYIESDQLAYLHEGEAVVPKKYNPEANLTELEMLRKQNESSQYRSKQESNQSQKLLQDNIDMLSDIKEFMQTWKKSNDKKTTTYYNRLKSSSQVSTTSKGTASNAYVLGIL